MAGLDRHLVVLGCGLACVTVLAFGSGFAAASWLAVPPARLGEAPAATVAPASDCPVSAEPSAPARAADAGAELQRSAADLPAEAAAPAGKAGIRVQVGSFLDPQAAGAIAGRLGERGYQAVVERRMGAAGVAWFAPVLGVYGDRAVAAAAALDVVRRTGLEPRLVAAGGEGP